MSDMTTIQAGGEGGGAGGGVAAPAPSPAPAPAAQTPAAPVPAPAPAAPAPSPSPAPAPAGEAKSQEGVKPQPRAPEQYGEFVVPEDLQAEGAQDLTAFHSLAKELDLSQADAQKLVDFRARAMTAERTAWADAARSDAEFGGEKLNENMAIAKKAIEAFGTDELKGLLNRTGIGNHPEVIRAFYRAGKAISDDKVVIGNQSPARSKSAAEILYDNRS